MRPAAPRPSPAGGGASTARSNGRVSPGRYDSEGGSFLALDRLPLPDYSRRGKEARPARLCWTSVFKWLAIALALVLAVVAGAVLVEQYHHRGAGLHATWTALVQREPATGVAPELSSDTTTTTSSSGRAPRHQAEAASGVTFIKPMIDDVVANHKHTPESVAQLRQAAAVLDPELMATAPVSFDKKYKNPCSMQGGSVRCLPYFYVAGCPHSGAGTLAQKLAEHPSVQTSGDVSTPSTFWVDETKTMAMYLDSFRPAALKVAKDPTNSVIMDNAPSAFNFYWASDMRAHRTFQASAAACWKTCSDAAAKGGLAAEACAAATCLQAAGLEDRQRATDAGILYTDQHLPLLMSAVYGATAPWLLVVARDPIARMHSAYWSVPEYWEKHGATAEGFLAFVKEQVGAFQACTATGKSDQDCAMYFEALSWEQEKVFYHCVELIRGMYVVFLEAWLRFVPRDRILMLKSEEYFADSHFYLARVVKFLGLHEPDGPTLKAMDAVGTPTSNIAGQPEMHPEARKLLVAFYKPFNLRLAQVTGNPLFVAWTVHGGR